MKVIIFKLHNKRYLCIEDKQENSYTPHTRKHNRGPLLSASAIKVLVILRQRLFESSSSPVSSAIFYFFPSSALPFPPLSLPVLPSDKVVRVLMLIIIDTCELANLNTQN